jgi:hypothetical protein
MPVFRHDLLIQDEAPRASSSSRSKLTQCSSAKHVTDFFTRAPAKRSITCFDHR